MGTKILRIEALISGALLLLVFVTLQITRSSFVSNIDRWMNSSQTTGEKRSTTKTRRKKASNPRAFVCITGQLSRLELQNKEERLFRYWHDNFGVDFDVALVLSATNYSSAKTSEEVEQNFFHTTEVAEYLSTIPGVTVLNNNDFVASNNPIVSPLYFKQISTDNNRGSGHNLHRTQNHVRQYESMAQCYSHMIQSPSAANDYDIVHRIRDDSGYYLNVPYDKLLKMTQQAPKTIVSSSCQQHSGINDRGSFVSPAAAYDYFVHPIIDMYTKSLPTDVRSMELFLMNTYSKTCSLVETHHFRIFRIWTATNEYSQFYPGTRIPRFLPGTNFDSEKGTLNHCLERLDSHKPLRDQPRCHEFSDGREACVDVA